MSARLLIYLLIIISSFCQSPVSSQTVNQVLQRVIKAENAIINLRKVVKDLSEKVSGLLGTTDTSTGSATANPLIASVASLTTKVADLQTVTDGLDHDLSILGSRVDTCCRKPTSYGPPTSCHNIYELGHSYNGFYTVLDGSATKQVYCDLSDPADVLQMDYGFIEAYNHTIHFHVSRSASFTTSGATVTYDLQKLNVGQAFSLNTGVFTAPGEGIYLFQGHFLKEANRANVVLSLQVNGVKVAKATSSVSGTVSQNTVTLSAIVHLQPGDIVNVVLESGTLSSGENQFFQGIMLRDLSAIPVLLS